MLVLALSPSVAAGLLSLSLLRKTLHAGDSVHKLLEIWVVGVRETLGHSHVHLVLLLTPLLTRVRLLALMLVYMATSILHMSGLLLHLLSLSLHLLLLLGSHSHLLSHLLGLLLLQRVAVLLTATLV